MDDQRDLTFTLNGRPTTARVDGRKTLLRYLRDDLGMMGTKDGCTTGDCGSCTVLIDGRPVDACVHRMDRVDGARIETIEGLARPDGSLHPIQAAFLDRGGFQCGFCTPGMIMAAKAILDKDPHPTEARIRKGLKGNLCRCTGYLQIFEAVQQAGEWLADPESFEGWEPTRGGVGTPTVLVDGHLTVQGTLPFVDDLVRPDMLEAAVVWAAHPYARIRGLDTTAAERASGVRRVVTAADVPGLNRHGIWRPDQPVFCDEYVRFTGDPVAAVLADTREQATAAARLVKVDYEVLDGLFSPAAALAEGAPQLTPETPGNVCKRVHHEKGDVDAAMASAAFVVEGHFTTSRQDHGYLEPMAALAELTPDGGVTVTTQTQSPFEVREQLVRILDLPKERIRVIAAPLGGAFGGKGDICLEAMVTVAALAVGRPVKMTLSREESLRTSVKRHPYELDYRVGADADGHLVAVDARLVQDCGPYDGHSHRVIDQACIFACGPYRIPNTRVDGTAVVTNNPLGGPFRGFGINQGSVAMESLLDELALEMGLDPFELRRRNLVVQGDSTNAGQLLSSSVAAMETLEACKAMFDEEWPTYRALARPGYRVGWGMASCTKNVGAGKGKLDDGGATLTLKPGGRVELRTTVIDMGQAIRTTMGQLACESSGIDFRLFDILSQDTGLTHDHRTAAGQRQTLVSGKAAVLAGEQFRDLLLDRARDWTGREGEAVELIGDEVRTVPGDGAPAETVMTLGQLYETAAGLGVELKSDVYYLSPQTWPLYDEEALRTVPRERYRNYATYNYATHVAFVGVNEATGRVDVLRILAAHDCGKAINPLQIRGQLIGSVSQGQGYALSEDYPTVNGDPPWPRINFRRLGVPTSLNAASVRVQVIEDPFPEGPYGAKGVSETATVPSTPAILNAIRQATGVRVHRIPVEPALLQGSTTRSAT